MLWSIATFIALSTVHSLSYQIHSAPSSRTFAVDYEHDTFLKDGQPFRYISCTMHYFQIPYELWNDRMLRVRALGCNVLQTYIMWSIHQPNETAPYVFERDANVSEYLRIADDLGFLVVIRPGPFINAEMDFGGLPYWLLKKKDIVLRAHQDQYYLKAVKKWISFVLANVVKPFLYQNGGPIILAQIENEYGDDPNCDGEYMIWLRDLFRYHLGNQAVLITTDSRSPRGLSCGHVEGAVSTVDFGCDSEQAVNFSFDKVRQVFPKGPLVNSEFYPGWIDHWGDPKHSQTSLSACLNTMRYMWNLNVTSFNIYPAHGGTNWGYSAGGKYGDAPYFQSITTGYDFDAPISESGDTTAKFVPMRRLIEKLSGRKVQDPVPVSPAKHGYGRFRMEHFGTILDLINSLTLPNRVTKSKYPLSMEELDQPYGFVLYQAIISKEDWREMKLSSIRDRAYIFIDGQLTLVFQRKFDDTDVATISSSSFAPSLRPRAKNGSTVQILVENQGRIGYGPKIKDPKGLLANVTVDGKNLTDWTMYPIDLSLIHKLPQPEIDKRKLAASRPRDKAGRYLPSVYFGQIDANSSLGDTFYDPSGWGKGQLFLNGRNIGRYWPQAGPQITLYVPQVYLNQWSAYNQVYVFELDQPGSCETNEATSCYANFVDQAIFR